MSKMFYRLHNTLLERTWCPVLVPDLKGVVSAKDLDEFRRGRRSLERELSFELKGTKASDLLSGEDLLFASENFRAAIKKENFTGAGFSPVSFQGKKVPKAQYYILKVTGKGGARTGKIGGPITFDLDRWDGSDFFMLDSALYVLVTHRVKDLLDSSGLSGVCLDPLTGMG